MEGNITLLKDKIKEIAIEILEIEKERQGLKLDMRDLRIELNCQMSKSMSAKAIKLWLGKGSLTAEAVEEYQALCSMLGLSCTFNYMNPEKERYDMKDPVVKERHDKIVSILQRYQNLHDEHNECSVQIRDLYAKAKNCGISVPLLKKLVDFVLHPDKLRAYQEDTPLLEVYTEVIPEIE